MNNEKERLSAMIPPLCIWYEANRKSLPWREQPTPYHVWLSEIMLQQTRIEAVIPYYHRFLTELPSIEALAHVSDDRLMKLWQGLGYYSRARNLKKAAGILMNEYNGHLPDTAEALRKLPGIGEYTAGAIASIAFHKPEPAVDGNVLRVIMRLTACTDDILRPATKRSVIEKLRSVYPSGTNAALLTEGLMELGETICIPNGEPRCEKCPIRDYCQGFEKGNPADYPTRMAKKERRIEKKTILLLEYGKQYAIVKRPETGLLASMWEFPNQEGKLTVENVKELLVSWGLSADRISPCGNTKHIFSHVEWHMTGYWIQSQDRHPDFCYATLDEIAEQYALPTAFRFYMSRLSERNLM